MIKVNANISHGYIEITAVGHAEYGPKGQDIVCASISSIIQTCLLGIQAVAEQYPENVSLEVTQEAPDDG